MKRVPSSFRLATFAVCTVLAVCASRAGAQSATTIANGKQVFLAACAGCHGTDGKGREQHEVGFADALPDFTDCSYASREAAQDWQALVHEGGPVRSFSRRMPSFGKALSAEQIEQVVAYVRSFCADQSWPRGELNLPRAIETEKAFPEDEAVLTAGAVTRRGERSAGATLIYERRIGAKTQWELAIPFARIEQASPLGSFATGLGDIAVALKQTLIHNGERGHILSAGVEAILPTGNADKGFGSGTMIAEPFVLAAKTIGAASFAQFHGGFEFPFDNKKAENEIYGRLALGTTFTAGFGRAFSPMIEVVGARALESGSTAEMDWIPQLQVSLSRRQHILASVGVRMPLTERERPRELLMYVIWDWFDGGLFSGWR